MKKIINWLAVTFCTTLLLSSCSQSKSSGNLYTPSASDVTATATLSELQQGRSLYINNCGSCHSLYSPDDYAAANWRVIVTNMKANTTLTQPQADLVTKYVSRGK
ncbi:MAG: cytochrome c [Bacteroidales bacterium]|nr:cytochrome c [Bacteroidales bacterium]